MVQRFCITSDAEVGLWKGEKTSHSSKNNKAGLKQVRQKLYHGSFLMFAPFFICQYIYITPPKPAHILQITQL